MNFVHKIWAYLNDGTYRHLSRGYTFKKWLLGWIGHSILKKDESVPIALSVKSAKNGEKVFEI